MPDERASFQLTFPDGLHAACVASQNATQSSALRLLGTEGELTVENAFFLQDRSLTLTRSGGIDDDSVTATVDPADGNQMLEEFDYFADCVLAGADPEADGRHALTDMRTIEAVYEAAERGETVRI